MNSSLLDELRRRADDRCEYCHVPQAFRSLRLQLDHIIARQHGGSDEMSNLALACVRCNLHKGPNLAGVDRTTGVVVRLFDPRSQRWPDHFRLDRGTIIGLTDVGRTTIFTLDMNVPDEVALRATLQDLGFLD